MAHWSVMVTGRDGTGGVPPEVDRLTRSFVADLRAAGLDVVDAHCNGAFEVDDRPQIPATTSDSPHSDLPIQTE